MQFITEENIFPQISSFLRKLSHDVKCVKESGLYKLADNDIAKIAIDEKRTIVTFDKHFGDIRRYNPKKMYGIIVIRIEPPLISDVLSAINNLFKHYKEYSFTGRLIVLSKSGYRIR